MRMDEGFCGVWQLFMFHFIAKICIPPWKAYNYELGYKLGILYHLFSFTFFLITQKW
jgi:hypothetical protein